MRNHKTPTEKRTNGQIYRYEIAEERSKTISILSKCKKQCRKIVHIVKNPHDLTEKRIIQVVKP